MNYLNNVLLFGEIFSLNSFQGHLLCKLVFLEDPTLAMTFFVAQRSKTMLVLLVNGTYQTSNWVYLDSLILQGQL